MPKAKVKVDPPLRTSLLSHNQLIDSLTSHIALYNSSSSSKSSSSNPNPRSSILKWFQSLSVPQRQSHLTIIDPSFVQVLIQMLAHLHHSGHGFFIVLPDLPSDSDRTLPSLCYRKSDGLLSRISESNRVERSIFDSVRIFSSKEGENVGECSVSMNCLDCVSVSEEFVENVDSFVGIMDCVSNGGFLRGEESGLGKDWVELGWLKDKGYYSIEAFVANRLEVTLRSAWLCCVGSSGRKRGVKLKEKNAVTLSGVAENIFWRKKGCVDWWRALDVETRRKVLATALGKSAKALSQEILVEANGVSKDKQWAFGIGGGQLMKFNHDSSSLQRPWRGFLADAEFGSSLVQDSLSKKPALTRASNHLFVLREIVTIIWSCFHSACDRENMFYSSLSSVGTLSDCILRKVRGFLMFISLEYTKLELLGEGNSKLSPYRSKEKLDACTRKKKGKPRNNPKSTISITSSGGDSTSVDQLHEDVNCTSKHSEKSMLEFSKTPKNPQKCGTCEDTSSIKVEMEPVQHSFTGKDETASRKSKREKRKNKKSIFKTPAKDKSLEKASAEAPSSSVILHDDMASSVSCLEPYDSLSICDSRNGDVPRKHILASKNGHSGKDGYSKISDEFLPAKLIMGSSDSSVSCSQISNTVVEDSCLPSGSEILDRTCKAITSNCSSSASRSTSVSEGGDMSKSVNMNSNAEKLAPCIEQSSGQNEKERSVPSKDVGNSNGSAYVRTLDCQSHEWPNAAASHFPCNSQLPPATDRLHLDVGLNWQNHFCQPFLPAVRQARNHPIENGCKQIVARPMPMSVDWPPMVRSACGLASSFTCNYDAGFISRRQSVFHQSFSTHMGQHSLGNSDEKKYPGDFTDIPDSANAQERADEYDSQWFSEEEPELHGVSGLDYNQCFGGGVMYWNPSDHPGNGYSRPPSLSSDDSFWAWQEADINRAVDDMVAFSSSYSTTGLASPTAASFCSPFEPLSSGHQALGYVVQGNEVPGQGLNSSSPAITEKVGEDEVSGPLAGLPVEVEVRTGDSLPYPILRPIIIPNISRERSSPRPLTRREQPRIKRPPSPVVLCVPRAPRPPPPSPVGDSRKHRGFPTVRSGSSSPRHWGMRGWYHDGGNLEEGCLRVDGAEVVLPWRNNNRSSHPMIQPLPGSLLQDRLIAISHLTRDQEHPDVAFPLQSPELQNSSARKVSPMLMHSRLHDEIDAFCKQVAAENLSRKPFINWAVKRVTRSLQVLWPRSRTNIFGSNATGLSLPSSDVDLVVCLPPVRNLEPIKEAGILEGRNGIKETCLQHAARYLANQEWVKNDSLKTVENTAIPVIKLVVEVPHDLVSSGTSNVPSPKEGQRFVTGEHCSQSHASESVPEDAASPKSSQANSDDNKDSKYVRLDISFTSVSHTGLQTTELVKELTEQFPAVTPLALVLKQFLADRSLDQSYSGGLSSHCLVLLITRFLQHEHHLGRSINQSFGSLLMDFLYFFGNVFDPRHMRISVQGSGLYMKRERGYSIDPLHIDDPLFPANNVGRNCFRIHQCIKAFSEAYSILEEELTCLPDDKDNCSILPYKLLPKIIPSIETL